MYRWSYYCRRQQTRNLSNQRKLVDTFPNEDSWIAKSFSWIRSGSFEWRIILMLAKYAKELRQNYGMLECKPISLPMEINIKLNMMEGKDLKDSKM